MNKDYTLHSAIRTSENAHPLTDHTLEDIYRSLGLAKLDLVTAFAASLPESFSRYALSDMLRLVEILEDLSLDLRVHYTEADYDPSVNLDKALTEFARHGYEWRIFDEN